MCADIKSSQATDSQEATIERLINVGQTRSEMRIAIPQLRGDDIEWLIALMVTNCSEAYSLGISQRDSELRAGMTDERLAIENAQTLAAKLIIGPDRCGICHWPLADSAKRGCVIGDCSYRANDEKDRQRIRHSRAVFDSYVAAIVPAIGKRWRMK